MSEDRQEEPGMVVAVPGFVPPAFWDEALPDRRTEPLVVTGQRMDTIVIAS